MDSINDRIKHLVDTYCDGNNSIFANRIGVNEANVRNYIKGTEPKFNIIYKIATNFELSFEWLVLGVGNPEKKILNSKTKSTEKTNKKKVSKKVSKNTEKQKVQKKLTFTETPTEKESAGIPLIPIEAMAGWGTGEVQVMDYEMGLYKVPEFDNIKVDFMIRARGSSMYPKYNSGDTLACLKVDLGVFFQWNKVYVLDTSQGAMVKRIKKSDKENHILCVSDNPNYDPFDLPLEDLYAIALVVGVIRLE